MEEVHGFSSWSAMIISSYKYSFGSASLISFKPFMFRRFFVSRISCIFSGLIMSVGLSMLSFTASRMCPHIVLCANFLCSAM